MAANPDGVGWGVVKSPLLELSHANVSHYQIMADHRHSLHNTSSPTPWVSGISTRHDDEGNPIELKLEIGAGTAWILDDPQARAGFLEFQGHGLEPQRQAMTDLENRMAHLGARLLDQKKAAESGEALRIRQAAENATLVDVVVVAAQALEEAIRLACRWVGKDEAKVSVEADTDFVSPRVDPQMLQQLMGAVQAGRISQRTFLEALKRGQILPDSRSVEEEMDLIDLDGGGLGE